MVGSQNRWPGKAFGSGRRVGAAVQANGPGGNRRISEVRLSYQSQGGPRYRKP